MPEISTMPIVNLDSKPAPDPKTRGIIPITVENPVIRTGLNLILQASIRALYDCSPLIFNCLANSTIKIPFFAEMPIKIIKPII